MSATEADHDGGTDAPSVNGHALDSVDGVRRAFGYLKKEYNDGDLYDLSTLTGDDAVAIESRSSRFQHMESLLDARCGGYVHISDISASGNGNLRIEIVEV